jgi:hypothetical protein
MMSEIVPQFDVVVLAILRNGCGDDDGRALPVQRGRELHLLSG